MTFTHSFWSKPLFDRKFERYFTYEHAVKNTLLDYAYSVACIHKLGHKIILYADKAGIELLSCIPYDKIIEINIPDSDPMHFAAQPKFHALRLMNSGDILIDGDIFIETQNILDDILSCNSDLLYSFTELNEQILNEKLSNDPTTYYNTLLPKFHNTLFPVPTLKELTYPNTSLLQINNETLKEKYVDQYFYHKNLLKDVDWEYTWPDLIIEQYFLWEVSKGYNIQPLIQDYTHLTERDRGLVHLGSGKTKFQNQVRQKLYFTDKQLFKAVMKKIDQVLES